MTVPEAVEVLKSKRLSFDSAEAVLIVAAFGEEAKGHQRKPRRLHYPDIGCFCPDCEALRTLPPHLNPLA